MEFRLLGPLEVVDDDGAAVALGGQRPRALLALLLLNANEVVSDRPPARRHLGRDSLRRAARARCRCTCTRSRRLSAPTASSRARPAISCASTAEELDVDRFERLVADGIAAEALALWRGRALADVAYESFAQAEAARLEESRLAALEARIDADLDDGRHSALVAELDALVAAHPHRERLQAQRMLALYRAGRQADALESLQEARDALEELGLEPSAELRELEQRILNHDPSLAAPAAEERRRRGARRTRPTLIGRDLELAAILALLGRSDVRLLTLTGHGRHRQDAARARGRRGEPAAPSFVDLAPLADAQLVLADRRGRRSGSATSRARAGGARRRARRVAAAPRARQPRAPARVVRGRRRRCSTLLRELRILATSRVPLRLALEHEYRVPPLGVPELGVETAAEADDRRRAALRRAGARGAARLRAQRRERRTPSRGSAARSTGSRSRSSSRPRACACSAPRGPRSGSGSASRCSTRARRTCPSASGRCARRSTGATNLLDDAGAPRLPRRSPSSPAAPRSTRVEAVADAGIDVPTALEALLDSGLVTHEAQAGEPRFGMLETIREFAAAELREAGEEAAARGRHLDHFVEFAEAVELRSRRRGHRGAPRPRRARARQRARRARRGGPRRRSRAAAAPGDVAPLLPERPRARRREPQDGDGRARAPRRCLTGPARPDPDLGRDPARRTPTTASARSHASTRHAGCSLAAGDLRAAALADANAATALSRLGRVPESAQRVRAGARRLPGSRAQPQPRAR